MTSDQLLSADLCGIALRNPTILASGVLGTEVALLRRVAENGAGAVTIKSITAEPRAGHNNPTVITFEAGMMNAVGYSNPGVEKALEQLAEIDSVGVPVIASATASSPDEFGPLVERLLTLDFAAIEIPLSCPHTPGFGTLAGLGTPQATFEATAAVRRVTSLPLFVKVSPSVPEIGRVAKAAEDAGADAITAVNTLGPGMAINLEAREPVLDFKVGGVSGPALRPVAVRCVYDIYESVGLPIVGVGGVSTGQHAIEMIMAGATAVGIGTGVYYRGRDVFQKVCDEMAAWMREHDVESLDDLVGAAHD